MTLTALEIEVISKNPLDDALDRFHDKLRTLDETDRSWQDTTASIVLTLVDTGAALNLGSRAGNETLSDDLFPLYRIILKGPFSSELFRPLVCCVVDKAPDIDVWEVVFDTIETFHSTSPLSSIAPTFQGTPVKTSSSRLADSETRDIIEEELFFETKDCTFRGVAGFCDKFFNAKDWRPEQRKMQKAVMAMHDGKKWIGFPAIPDEKPVWDWLCLLEERSLVNAPYKLHTTNTANQFKERKGQMDLFFQIPAKGTSSFKYKQVLVVGEQKKSNDSSKFKATLLQLTRYVRGVFADQPTRRFVHGFTLCASIMELWVFDRSGPYSSGPFDIHDEPEKFARAIVGYATMDDDTMGLDTFIERGDWHRCITVDDTNGNEMTAKLGVLLVRQKAIVCRGTTCFKSGNHVVKFSWASDKRKLEVQQLQLAEEKGVEGVARAVAYCCITTIADMRKGLQFSERHRFRNHQFQDEDAHLNDLPSVAAGKTSSNKRESSTEYTSDVSRSKRQRSSHHQTSKLASKVNNQFSVAKTKPSLYTQSNDLWENKIYSCLIISPAGRVISNYKTIRELLESMRDAIRAHQSLYTAGSILHRDISSNNIIITNPKEANGFSGMLIDLDLAIVKDSSPSGARHQTGTMQSMAIEVLRKVDHTYRHDLESFFYVLLWMCARQSWNNGFSGKRKPPRESLLRKWEVGSFKDIARTKAGDMAVDGLEAIMGEFPDALEAIKPLCLRIRKILFPLDEDERMNFGTPTGDPNQLYGPIIAAYDGSIREM
ncbi:serine/threonine-protein kinase Sgk2 [Drechmeria coniospora]|uniref:non-specific serine/threonine protein kinase n=1 Tax=Drechmeria coniospora TaxID=98403 RepID=A0A151GJP4_DRECN|nr:serine/threonine-protein kinase Sgk2 [Drechmeria coniospora]KYK57232.1 serine/threonine-protein kinase Sgk2 [Drechmeria coniospora]